MYTWHLNDLQQINSVKKQGNANAGLQKKINALEKLNGSDYIFGKHGNVMFWVRTLLQSET